MSSEVLAPRLPAAVSARNPVKSDAVYVVSQSEKASPRHLGQKNRTPGDAQLAS